MSLPSHPAPVAAARVDSYDYETILAALRIQAQQLELSPTHFQGKRVAIKPNLVAPMHPDGAATTHPVFLRAVVALLREYGAEDLLLAESPGGLYSEATLQIAYKNCKILDAAKECGLTLNYDTSAVEQH